MRLMCTPASAALAALIYTAQSATTSDGETYESDFARDAIYQQVMRNNCPDYTDYALQNHAPYSKGPLRLSHQRPHANCRKCQSSAVERVVEDFAPMFKDADLAHIFGNAFPNTLDTTIRWHKATGADSGAIKTQNWNGAQSFIVTGDINAEWLRDSTNQLAPYQGLAASSQEIYDLIRGAINTQTEYVIESPYCNAFQPPSSSGLDPAEELWVDEVRPKYSSDTVFECRYELGSLANHLALSNQFFTSTKGTSFATPRWFQGLSTVLAVLDAQAMPTFNPETGTLNENQYTFQRTAKSGTETLVLEGLVFGFLIPANAMMSVELQRTADLLQQYVKDNQQSKEEKDRISELSEELLKRSHSIRRGVFEHGVVQTKNHGKIFAFEVDGFGSSLLMDDANIPSLLSLPYLGFVNSSNEIHQNTRRFIPSPSNPYYLTGKAFSGIGGPHIGLRNAWPMSVLTQALTSDSDAEIMDSLDRVKNGSVFGLVNESVDVDKGISKDGKGNGLTRSWFAWANSVFSQVILDLAKRKPHLIFTGHEQYVPGFIRSDNKI